MCTSQPREARGAHHLGQHGHALTRLADVREDWETVLGVAVVCKSEFVIKMRTVNGATLYGAHMFVDIREVSYDGSIQRVTDGTTTLTLPIFERFRLVVTDRLRVSLDKNLSTADCVLKGLVYQKKDDGVCISCGGMISFICEGKGHESGDERYLLVSKARRRKRGD